MQHMLELPLAIQARRRDLGLTQAALAQLSGLSRATVNALESGAIKDLSVGRLSRLLQLLGLRLGLESSQGALGSKADVDANARRSLQAAAQTASVSYARVMPVRLLQAALALGELPHEYRPHLATLLDEAPLPMVVAAVGAAAQLSGMPAAQVWKHVGAWARELQSLRSEWRAL
jgi:transcriptional regulator with XRE-family HTH domain